MPKVSEQYLEDKKNQIMDCAWELMREIPLYRITMRDIIKKLGCSQGLIYRYYQSVDEIYANLMNREIQDMDFKSRIAAILQKEEKPEIIIAQLFQELGKYMIEVQQKLGGKFFYELQVEYAFDEEKKRELLSTLLYKQNMVYFQEHILAYIGEQLQKRVLRLKKPTLSIKKLAVFAGAAIDGIGNYAALTGRDNVMAIQEEILELFALLSSQMISCLCGDTE